MTREEVTEGVLAKLKAKIFKKKDSAPKPSSRMTAEMKRKQMEMTMREYGIMREDLIEAILALEEDARINVMRSKTIRAKKGNVDPTERGFMKKQMMNKLRQGTSRREIKRDYKMLRAKGQV